MLQPVTGDFASLSETHDQRCGDGARPESSLLRTAGQQRLKLQARAIANVQSTYAVWARISCVQKG